MEAKMEQIDRDSSLQERSLMFTAVVYYMVMLAGLIVGLYGLFSLFSLATSQALRSQSSGLPF
jgi:hypothetical protein